jgi:hypothetical protein
MEAQRVTIEELKAMAQQTLDDGIAQIRDDGELHMMFYLFGRDGTREIAVCMPDITNSEEAKAAFARKLKERVRAGGVEAVAMVSDTYIAENLTPAQEAIRREFRMTIEDCWKAGMIPKREAVSVTLESPIYQQVARQEYRRVDGGRAIELVGAPEVTSSIEDANGKSGKYSGRMMGFFAHAREGLA